ncbi:MAG: hypothetical protein U0P45_07015 [Acidimicrobiales bacterium]
MRLRPDCSTYTPSALALDKTSVEPGENVQINGDAKDGDVLTFTISGTGVTSTNLGSGTVGSSNTFSKTLTMPDAYPAGTYNITVRSTTCSRSGTISILLKTVDRSGCATGNPLTLTRGSSVNWKLVNTTPPFNTTKPVTLKLNRRVVGGVSYTLYSGAWPASNAKVVAIPAGAPLDQYYVVQSGSRAVTNAAISVSCPVRVVDPPTTSTSAPLMPPRVIAAAVGFLLLWRLRRRTHRAPAA